MNCKPGDLAYIVSSLFSENVGKVVKVIEPATSWNGNEGWICEICTPLKALNPEGIIQAEKIIHCRDSSLRPISGVPVHDEQTNEVTA